LSAAALRSWLRAAVERGEESLSFEHLLGSRPVLILLADLNGGIDQE